MSALAGRTVIMSGGSRGIGLAIAKTGNFFIDEEVLAAHGVTDFDQYRVVAGSGELTTDMFLD